MILNRPISILLFFISLVAVASAQQRPVSKNEVINIIKKVNNYWQNTHTQPTSASWDEAAYHTGNIEAYKITGMEAYRKYSEEWAANNQWKGAKSDDTSKWKYTYGETDDYVLFGDWQVCFQVYCDLYKLAPDNMKIARALQVMEYQMSTPNKDYWWWVDGLYMVMPVMTKLYKITQNPLYLEKLYDYFVYADSLMFDSEAKLYYRDARYVFPPHKTINGKKDFWARGDGWVFAGLARIINDLPKNYKHKALFISRFKQLAQSIINCQQKEGYWTRSLIDPQQAPGYETSGTAFFTFGLLWGINNGYLKDKKYTSSALKGWNYLTRVALQPSGKIGYVQPIGDKAIAGQVLNENSTSNFGVGAFLLAASEMVKFAK
ncbi:glycoside hydrolase family 88 protein [Paludibacter sp.]|uniref:glycoside hydrolase family 88/105 protein n=1 Tax=Paludibacter sp. TaxID=1898105 RepID=UPI001353B94B|nr:glycoside hydrolase family 88 protein [Paludibacter sp.]MTK52966.1 glycoside hydrolase family 88 protein [Paludibacter sp.]